MSQTISIENHTIHLWRVLLTDFISICDDFKKLLNPDELERAERFHFPHHQQRFAIARGMLRKILSQYINVMPNKIEFVYGKHGKPELKENDFHLQFNVSHSEDAAVYAVMTHADVGVDIQKIGKYREAVAKRFFNKTEYAELISLPESERAIAFYRLWTSKEALIKAVGEGLYVPLGNFSVSLNQETQWVLLEHEQRTEKYFLANFIAFSAYQSAFATNRTVNKIIHWQWTPAGFMSAT